MAFISNASNFTLGDGVYTNVQGNIVHYHNSHFYGTKRRRDEIEDGSDVLLRPDKRPRLEEGSANGLKVIRQQNLQLIRQIGGGPGYLLHAGRNKSYAVTVKVFKGSGPTAREQLEWEVALLKGLIHSNVPRIKGVSSPTSSAQFIVYEDVCWQNAKGPLADALQNRTRSIRLGFKMVADLSAGLDYLSMQGISLAAMRVENFNVFLDVDDRFLLIINPKSPDAADANSQSSQDESSWALFNSLCHRVLVSANRVLHTEEINRDPALSPPTSSASRKSDSSLLSIGPASPQEDQQDSGSAGDPRREYVWKAIDRGQQCLATVADQMTVNLDMALARLHMMTRTDVRRAHRCRGYVREEITLAPTIVDSAVVAHDTPSPLEICSICHEVVNLLEIFRCVCGPDPGSRLGYTVKCNVCELWSHGECVGHVKSDFTCRFCEALSTESFFTGGHERIVENALAEFDVEFASSVVDRGTSHWEERLAVFRAHAAAQQQQQQQQGRPRSHEETMREAYVANQQQMAQQAAAASAQTQAASPGYAQTGFPPNVQAPQYVPKRGHDYSVDDFFTVGSPAYDPRMAERLDRLNHMSYSQTHLRTPEELAAVNDFLITLGRPRPQNSGFSSESYFGLSQFDLAWQGTPGSEPPTLPHDHADHSYSQHHYSSTPSGPSISGPFTAGPSSTATTSARDPIEELHKETARLKALVMLSATQALIREFETANDAEDVDMGN